MRRWVGGVVLVACVLLSAVASGQGVSPPALDTLRAEIVSAEEARVAAESRLQEARRELARETAEAEALKARMSSPFDVYELRGALREVQEAADRVSALDEALRGNERAASDALNALAAGLRERVQELNAALRSPETDRGAAIAELNALNAELGRLAVPLPAFTPVPIGAIVRGSFDTPEEMYDAAAELADAAARIERQLAELRQQLSDAQARARLIEASGEFAAEESLLDDDGTRRSGNRGGARATSAGGREPVEAPDTPTGATDSPNLGAPASPESEDFGGAEGAPGREDGEPPFDGSLGGGGDGIEFGGEVVVPPRPQAVGAGRGNADESLLLDERAERRSRGTRSAVESLRAHEAALLRELEAVRAERARLTEGARALERGE